MSYSCRKQVRHVYEYPSNILLAISASIYISYFNYSDRQQDEEDKQIEARIGLSCDLLRFCFLFLLFIFSNTFKFLFGLPPPYSTSFTRPSVSTTKAPPPTFPLSAVGEHECSADLCFPDFSLLFVGVLWVIFLDPFGPNGPDVYLFDHDFLTWSLPQRFAFW